jgi:hypothetical protein
VPNADEGSIDTTWVLNDLELIDELVAEISQGRPRPF